MRAGILRALYRSTNTEQRRNPTMNSMTQALRRGVLALAGSMLLWTAAHAEAPMAKTQAPGYFRMMLGDFEVTALHDGSIELKPTELLTNIKPAEVTKLLGRNFQKEPIPLAV